MTEEIKKERAIVPINVGERGLALRTLEDVQRLAKGIMDSSFAPKNFTKGSDVVIAIVYGMELGMQPLQALQNLAIINGKPSIYGDAAPALVRASGLMARHKEWFTGSEYSDDFTAHCLTQRRDEDETHETTFSVADAKRAELWNKRGRDGQTTPWVTYPKRMLMWRARGFNFRDKFPEALRGLLFVEEAQDLPREPRNVTPSAEADLNERFAPPKAVPVDAELLPPAPAAEPPTADQDALATRLIDEYSDVDSTTIRQALEANGYNEKPARMQIEAGRDTKSKEGSLI